MSFWLDQMEKIVLADKEKKQKEKEAQEIEKDDFIDRVAERVVKKLTGSVVSNPDEDNLDGNNLDGNNLDEDNLDEDNLDEKKE